MNRPVASDENELEMYQNFNLRDFDSGGIHLVDISFLARMFDLTVVNEIGKPIQLTLTEKQESFAARESSSVPE